MINFLNSVPDDTKIQLASKVVKSDQKLQSFY